MAMRTGGLMVLLLLAAAPLGGEGERTRVDLDKDSKNVSQCPVPSSIEGIWSNGEQGIFFDLRKAPECILLVTVLKENGCHVVQDSGQWKSPWTEKEWGKAKRHEKSYESALKCNPGDQQGKPVECQGTVRYDHKKSGPRIYGLVSRGPMMTHEIALLVLDNGPGKPVVKLQMGAEEPFPISKVRDRMKIPNESVCKLPYGITGTWRPTHWENNALKKQYVFDPTFYKKDGDETANACYIDVKVFNTYLERGKDPKPKSPRASLKCMEKKGINSKFFMCEGSYKYQDGSKKRIDLLVSIREANGAYDVHLYDKALYKSTGVGFVPMSPHDQKAMPGKGMGPFDVDDDGVALDVDDDGEAAEEPTLVGNADDDGEDEDAEEWEEEPGFEDEEEKPDVTDIVAGAVKDAIKSAKVSCKDKALAGELDACCLSKCNDEKIKLEEFFPDKVGQMAGCVRNCVRRE